MYQTDFDGIVREHGCLVFSLCKLTLDKINEATNSDYPWPNRDRMMWFFEAMNEDGVLSRSRDNTSEFGMYVRSHRRLIDGFCDLLGFKNLRSRYIAAHYMQGESAESWGDSAGHDKFLLQVSTLNGNGHFRLWDYDPSPGAGISKLRSVRYYRFEGVK